MKKDEENPTCFYCKKKEHEEEKCWKLHLEILPNKFKDKGKQKTVVTIQQDLGSDSGDETKIIAMGINGISNASSSFLIQTSKLESVNYERKLSDLFHIRVITKNKKVDTLFDSGSQVNLV